jgi:hypothetical protein
MDLALHLGCPLSVIGHMSERELHLWDRYRIHKGFPMRRIELGLAQVSLWIAKTMGGVDNLSLKDFLFDAAAEEDAEEMTEEELAELKEDIGFNPIN